MNKNLTVVRVAQGSDDEELEKTWLSFLLSEWWVKVGGKQIPLSALEA